jgi:excisionase family DNA binding protein
MGKKITLDDAADQLGVSKRTVRRLISNGDLRGWRLGRTRVVRVDADEVSKALQPIVPNGKR